MTTPSEQLRTAAETLRTMATEATPGPWEPSHDKPSPHRPPDTYDVWGPDIYGLPYDDAAFIALMDPTTALLLADWLEATAMEWPRISKRDVPMPKKALALAEYVNGRKA